MMDFRSWPKKWNDASLRRIARLPETSTSRGWPLLGMLAIGLVAGAALGGYAVSQRSQVKRLAMYGRRMREELTDMGKKEAVKPVVVVTTHRTNHRRKVASEV